ncbi:MAG TPA: YfcE family phosphodiesterase [Bacillota bacterium]|nr:YfcE family phosphodiesterase [Bacillota bacterium]
MRMAIIGDIHSNLAALESVLKDIGSKNVDFILCTGDLVGYAPFPNEVIEKLRQAHVLTVQGNYDEAIGHRRLICGCDYKDEKQLELASLSVGFTNTTITPDNREYLKNLPRELSLKMTSLSLRIVHGSPRRNNEYLFESSQAVEAVVQELEEDILICGHTHIPYHKVIQGKQVINSGSIGKPKHGNPNATYVIIQVCDSKVEVQICETGYDVEKTARAIEANNTLPNEFAQMLRRGM